MYLIGLNDLLNIDNYDCLFVGPSFAGRTESSKFLLVTSVVVGPMFYKDKINFDEGEIYFDKTIFGFNAGIAGEYNLSDKAGIDGNGHR